MSNSDSNP